MKVSDKLLEQTGIIGEKIELGGFKYISAAFVGSYIHAGNKIASLTGLSENFENGPRGAKGGTLGQISKIMKNCPIFSLFWFDF